MTGLLALILLTLLPQGSALPLPASVLPNATGTTASSGWEMDQERQKFTYIIQIAPSAISAFAQGPTGNELPVPIESHLIGRVEQIAIRFDTKELPRIDPPIPSSRSQASTQASIQNLALMRYAPQTLAGANQWEDLVGWEFDNNTNRFTYIVQIPVASLEQFMVGPNGSELMVPIHTNVIDFVEQVTVRVGSGPLPKGQVPETIRAKYQTFSADNIRPLGGTDSFGAPVSIDPTPISGASDLGQPRGNPDPILPDFSNSNNMSGSTGTGFTRPGNNPGLNGSNMSGINNSNLPTQYGSNPNNASRPSGFPSSLNSETPSLAASQRASERDLIPSSTNRLANNIFGSNDSTQQNVAGSRFPSGQDPRNMVGGPNPNPNQLGSGYLTPQPQYANNVNQSYPQIANNQMQQYSNPGFSNVPTSIASNPNLQTHVTPVSLQGVAPAQAPLVDPQTQQTARTAPESKIGFNWALAALVLLGFNIYQFFWMSNARIKYRQMIVSKRSTRLEPTA